MSVFLRRIINAVYVSPRNLVYVMNGEKNKVTLQRVYDSVEKVEKQLLSLNREVANIKRNLKVLIDSENTKRPTDQIDLTSSSEKQEPPFKRAKQDLIMENGYVQVYTDGACENNGKANAKAGIGVWFGDNNPSNLAEPVRRRPTNNVGEIEACTRAVQQAHEMGVDKLCINTDSEFVINCATKWMPGWKQNGWKTASGNPVKNKDELVELEQNIGSMDVKWNHVRGHRGNYGNEAADKLAREGAARYSRR